MNDTYFDAELKSTIVGAVIGALVGYLSFLINQPLINLVVAVVIFGVLSVLYKKVAQAESKQIAMAYFLAWIVVWTLFYNTRIV